MTIPTRASVAGRSKESAPAPLGDIDDAGPARIVGLSASAPVSFKYTGAYVEGTGKPGIAVPSLYEYQLEARAKK